MSRRRVVLGASGEELVASWYEARGYQVVDRNWRCRDGEIDLIVRAGSDLAFCEVKTRTSLAFGHPAEAVTVAKQRRLRLLASRWLAEGHSPVRPSEIRFDVAAVIGREVDVIEAAF